MDREFPDTFGSDVESGVFSPAYSRASSSTGFRSPAPSNLTSAMASPARRESDDEFVLPGLSLTHNEFRAFRSADVSDEEAFGLALRSPNFGILADVTFRVGQRVVEEVYAHSLILARRSDYFFEIFFNRNDVHNCLTDRNRRKTFCISNMEPDGFRIMLDYLYTKKINLPTTPSDGNANSQVCLLLETLRCSKVINHPELEHIGTSLLMERLSVNNSINCLNWATKYKCTMFQQKVLEFIGRHIFQIIWTDAFNEFSENALVDFLQYDEWNLPEYQIFDAVVEWAKNKYRVEAHLGSGNDDISSESLRTVMGRTFFAIRFPLMGMEEQRNIITNYPGLLTDRERLELYDHFMQSGDAALFTARRRQGAKRPGNSEGVDSPDADSNQKENNNQYQNEQDANNINENRELENPPCVVDNQQEGGYENGSEHEENETEDASANNTDNDNQRDEPTQRELAPEDDDTSQSGSEQSDHSSEEVFPLVLQDSIAKDHDFKEPPPKKSKPSTPMPSTSKAARHQSGHQKSSRDGGAVAEENQGQGQEKEMTSLENYVSCLMGKNIKSNLTTINATVKFPTPKHRIDLPCLKNFNLALTTKNYETGTELKNYIGGQSDNLHRILFFKYEDSDRHPQLPEDQGDYYGSVLAKIMAHIFRRRINVSIKISDVQILKICHRTGTLSVSILRNSQQILDSYTKAVETFTLKNLALNECAITSLPQIRPDDLETFRMRYIKGPNNKQGNLFKDFTNMREYVNLGTSNTRWGTFDLQEEVLQVMPQLQKLCLSRCTLYFKNDMSQFQSNVQELFLDDVVAPPAVCSVFPSMFHNVRKLCLYGRNIDPECLYWILRMPSVECIFGWHFVYSEEVPAKSTSNLKDLFHFLARVFDEAFAMDLSAPFLMQRRQAIKEVMNPRDWVGTKLETKPCKKFEELVFQSKLLDTFFDNLERFQCFIKPKEGNRNGETPRLRRTTRKRKATLEPKRKRPVWYNRNPTGK